MPEPRPTPPAENTFVSLGCNIVLPVVILNHLTARLGPATALVLALAFPLGYGLWDWWRRRKANMFSILGLLNTLITGGLALIGVTGFWFAVKEAAFPFLIGLFVLGSSWTRKPAVQTIFLNPNLFQLERMQESIRQHGREAEFSQLLRDSTRWLALSFFFSAVLNFALASRIFIDLPLDLPADARSARLNEQIAQMTQWSMLVILVPSMAFLMGILYFVIRRIRQITGLSDDEFMKVNG
ncbi:MAG: hypothetical protein KF802_01965 [Bdellovibrionaceae bacterium]|nr:hypothetical protein [Pseudobdellovibrionaceae bacterium]MBX3033917.1 hypothetical protein [Pseudobdellovibrionaceae bacterium]